jgi:DNA-binding response OmpR family regulator
LLITNDPILVRSFRRELRRCADCDATFDVDADVEAAAAARAKGYHWVALDMDGPVAPSEAVRVARTSWPGAQVVALSCWWSERDVVARELADLVVHKPLRPQEVQALVRAASASRVPEPFRAAG